MGRITKVIGFSVPPALAALPQKSVLRLIYCRFNVLNLTILLLILTFEAKPALAEEIEQVANAERRTKSELFREMFRVYQVYRRQREQEEERWVMDLIRETKEEQEKNPMGLEDLIKELKELAREVSLQAKKRGIKPKDVNRIIDESRKRWQPS